MRFGKYSSKISISMSYSNVLRLKVYEKTLQLLKNNVFKRVTKIIPRVRIFGVP